MKNQITTSILSVKKVPEIDHSKSPIKEIVKNLFDAKLTPLSSIHSVFTVLDVVSLSQVCFAIFPMDKNIEQRIRLKFCIENGNSCAESLEMLQKTYGESTFIKNTCI